MFWVRLRFTGDRPSTFLAEDLVTSTEHFYGTSGILTSSGHYAHTSARTEVDDDDYTPND